MPSLRRISPRHQGKTLPSALSGVPVPSAETLALQAEVERLQRRISILEAERSVEKSSFLLQVQELAHARQVRDILPDLLPDVFVVAFNQRLRFTLAQGPLLRTLGYQPSDIVGKPVRETLPDGRGWSRWESSFRSVLNGNSIHRTTQDGDRYYRVDIVPLRDADGPVQGGLFITQDITQLTREQHLAEKRNEALFQTNRELNRYISSNLELEQFAYIAAHDLKEPIRTINSFAQLLLRRHGVQMDEEANEFVHFIIQGSRRMEALINGLLEYSSLDNREPAGMEAVSLHQVLEGVLSSLGNQIRERQAEVIFSEMPKVKGHPAQLGQLLQNLVSNGIKFNTSTQPLIRIEASADPDFPADFWRITVRDNGIGIPPDHADKIFGIFKRLHNRDEYEGAGIGLAVCRKIVERHGGRIWVEPPAEQGTRIAFTLPVIP